MSQVKKKQKKTVSTVESPLPEPQPEAIIFDLTQLPTFDLSEILGVPLGGRRKKGRVKPSRIRVQLNQPLTYAEAEDLKHRGVQFGLHVAPNRQHVYAEGPMDSRQMFRIVAKVIADRYVNIFPMAVRTFSEYTRGN